MRSFKKLSVLVAVFALCAIGAANASAAEFTAEEAGELTGKAVATQEFHTNGGTVKCSALDVTGTAAISGSSQHVTIDYTNCTAFGGIPVHISPATYLFTANGTVHLENTITIEVTVPLFPDCTVTVAGTQSLNGVTYSQNGNNVKVTPNPVKGIKYTSSGGVCGSSGENGEYTGASEVGLKSGKKVQVDTP